MATSIVGLLLKQVIRQQEGQRLKIWSTDMDTTLQTNVRILINYTKLGSGQELQLYDD